MLSPADISSQLAAHLVSVLSTPAVPGPWRESRHPYGAFFDASEVEHHAFVLRIGKTETLGQDRQNGSTYSVSELRVRWVHRLKDESAALDERLGLQAEVELTAAIKSVPELRMQFVSATREDRRNGTVLAGEIVWNVYHHHPLSTE